MVINVQIPSRDCTVVHATANLRHIPSCDLANRHIGGHGMEKQRGMPSRDKVPDHGMEKLRDFPLCDLANLHIGGHGMDGSAQIPFRDPSPNHEMEERRDIPSRDFGRGGYVTSAGEGISVSRVSSVLWWGISRRSPNETIARGDEKRRFFRDTGKTTENVR